MYKARFDGGCWPNPKGHASSACVIEKDGIEVFRQSRYIGHGTGMTNNVAEFDGVLLILKWLHEFGENNSCEIIGDSSIVVNRMKTQTLPKGICQEKAYDCIKCARYYKGKLSFKWETRDANDECDAMCDLEIEEAENRHRNGVFSI